MKIKAIYIGSLLMLMGTSAQAGNPDRAGSAGATQLLINPFARSSGWATANTSSIYGVEAMFQNVAGLAFTGGTELYFARTNWLQGSDVTINSVGLGQKIGDAGVLGLSVMVMNFGEIEVTTTDQPEGGLGKFSPNYSNIGLSYAKEFSNSIYGGITVRVISESIANVKASGFSFDAGIDYVTGETDNVKFGISLKNVGPPMNYSGDGLSFNGIVPPNNQQMTVEQRSANFEMPSVLNIGGSYDFRFGELHLLTLAGNFRSNSFTKDQFMLGAEYGFKKMFYLRGGFTFEDGVFTDEERTTVYTGPSAGVSVDIPFGSEKQSKMAFDYSYRATDPFDGVHSIGVRVALN